jgi:hypothetical protein
MHVLGFIPISVLAGLFLLIGEHSLSVTPMLFWFFHLLTPPWELPGLPASISTANPPELESYAPTHGYTIVQIVVTMTIFVVTLSNAARASPIIIIALVHVRLLLMNKVRQREVLRFVNTWAYREGIPDDDEAERELLCSETTRMTWTWVLEQDRSASGGARRQEDGEAVREYGSWEVV